VLVSALDSVLVRVLGLGYRRDTNVVNDASAAPTACLSLTPHHPQPGTHITQHRYPREKPIDFSLWFQASLAFQDYAPAVCTAMHPSDELQKRAQSYWDATLT
jgi:hypothetical protein